MMSILYPIKAKHTAPIIRSIAFHAARCQMMCDLLGEVEPTAKHIHNCAVADFRGFCERQEDITLTDDLKALEALYVDAYEGMYYQRYVEVMDNLAKMAEQRNCAD